MFDFRFLKTQLKCSWHSFIVIMDKRWSHIFFTFFCFERKFGFFWHISGKMFTAAVKLWNTPFLLGIFLHSQFTHNENIWPWNIKKSQISCGSKVEKQRKKNLYNIHMSVCLSVCLVFQLLSSRTDLRRILCTFIQGMFKSKPMATINYREP